MMLCLDAGNTRIKWALRDAQRPIGEWLATGALATADAARLLDQLPHTVRAAPQALAVMACNVAGAAVQQAIAKALPQVRWFAATPAQSGVRNHYARPERLGADRMAALVGAHARRPGPTLVVCSGTATTVDLLDAEGDFLGGLILPGIELMHRSLARDTAGLDVARGQYRLQPRCTEDAIASGALHATLGALERMFHQLPAPAHCLVTGGAAERLCAHLTLPHDIAPYLILEGLAVAADEAGT